MKPDQEQDKKIDLQSIRDQMARSDKEKVWRSFDELAKTPQFEAFLHQEFPRQASALDALSRRDFLKLLAAPLALAGLSACVPQPVERIAPYNEAPEDLLPGDPLFFATAMQLGGFARGLLAKSSMGRPIKLEGNPDHPASLGSTDAFAQGSILTLYDPDRAQVVTSRGRIRSYDDFQAELRQALTVQEGNQGAGLRILTGTVTSPTLAAQLDDLLERFPQAQWHQYDPISRDNVRQGAKLAFGEAVETRYQFENARIILSLDDDFTLVEPGNLRYVRDFADRRRVLEDQTEMNRLYVVESSLSNAGAIADHRLPLKASQVQTFARLLAQRLGLDVEANGGGLEIDEVWLEALVQDLQANQGSSLILAGVQQPPEVHALVHALNQSLGNVGSTVIHTDPVELNPVDQLASIQELVADLNAGEVDLLVMLGGNPAYTAPVDLNFAQALSQADLQVYLGLYEDETAALSSWHIPGTHFLEMWSDTRAYDGTVSVIQPLIEPLYDSVSPHELLALLLGDADDQGYDILRQFWQERSEVADFEAFWQRSLHDGVMQASTLPEKEVTVSPDLMGQLNQIGAENRVTADELEILFQPDPSVWDGRFTNNAWLQELPRPMTKLTWDNAVLISPSTALRLGLANEEVVNLRFQDFEVAAPVWI
ncbi:MAG TPA: TAT-variant-translocated molybdopterin oxidoreductase, partial [Anaerolineales bacterium]